MKARRIAEGVHWVGVIDWDRRLFDDLIPLPDGTSYNAYLVQGRKHTALIDSVDPPFVDQLLARLDSLGVERIDYLISNHSEQDHSGSIPMVLERFPMAQVVTSPKAKGILMDLLHIPEDSIRIVEDGETISLGTRTLRFLHAPWVHWPETMMTYLEEDMILFPCDLFGSHLATNELLCGDWRRVHDPAKRYFAEIMMPFRQIIKKHLARLEEFRIDVIAPSHGPVHTNPEAVMEAYRQWVLGEPKNLVLLPYISMHGSVKAMVDHLQEALLDRGVMVEPFNLADADLGRLAMAMVDAATLVIGSPTVLTGAHPKVVYGVYLANALRPKAKFASVIGSYGWGGRMIEQIKGLMPSLKVELLEPVVVRGLLREEDRASLDQLAETIAEKHATIPLSTTEL